MLIQTQGIDPKPATPTRMARELPYTRTYQRSGFAFSCATGTNYHRFN
ncbi:hypothetical protein SynA1825c_01882 [Synechococcus sp. A18-25c]|nr:hypothetical protein SynA1560_01899 [Synechococcus sp. A15-60]QNJ20183.1 hypothetical protein SynA1825c_01882 [Synechococcus sp. A18-25c]